MTTKLILGKENNCIQLKLQFVSIFNTNDRTSFIDAYSQRISSSVYVV